MGLRSAIGKKLYNHMLKKDISRRMDEKKTRAELPGYTGNQDQESRLSGGGLQGALSQSRDREKGSGFRARIMGRMQKWAGIEAGSFGELQSKRSAFAQVTGGGGEGRKASRDAYNDFMEGSRDHADDWKDTKNHDIALPKWEIDVDQNNRLAQFEDLIGGQHKQKKATRHVTRDGEPVAPVEAPAPISDLGPSDLGSEMALDAPEPVRKKKHRPTTSILDEMPAPVATATAPVHVRRQRPQPVAPVAEAFVPQSGVRKKKRRPTEDETA